MVADGAGASLLRSIRNGQSGIEAGLVGHEREQQRRLARGDRNDRHGVVAFNETRRRHILVIEIGVSPHAHRMEAHVHLAHVDHIARRPFEIHRQHNPFSIKHIVHTGDRVSG